MAHPGHPKYWGPISIENIKEQWAHRCGNCGKWKKHVLVLGSGPVSVFCAKLKHLIQCQLVTRKTLGLLFINTFLVNNFIELVDDNSSWPLTCLHVWIMVPYVSKPIKRVWNTSLSSLPGQKHMLKSIRFDCPTIHKFVAISIYEDYLKKLHKRKR